MMYLFLTIANLSPTNIEIKLPNETNQFPEIPYCKMTYDEVEKQVNDFFQRFCLGYHLCF